MSTIFTTPEFDLSQIINGVTVKAPSPFGFHQSIIGKIHFLLSLYLQSSKACKVFLSPLDIVLEKYFNVLQPDLIYIKKENMSIFYPDGHIHYVVRKIRKGL